MTEYESPATLAAPGEGIRLDTSITEPAMTAGEVEMLQFALARTRSHFAWKVGGLDAAGLNQAHPPSTMTLGGLVKHLAFVEDWIGMRLTGRPMPAPWNGVDWDADPDWPWHSASEDRPEELYRLWQEASARCRAAVEEVIADGGLDRPARTVLNPDRVPNARRLLTDLHDEYARHVGHADLFREAVDGLVGEDPPQS